VESGLKQDFILRKIAHIFEYGILCFLLLRALREEKISLIRIVIFSVILSFFYALSDEYHQSFIYGRYGSLVDVGIDSIGILIIGLLWYYKNKGRKNYSN